MLKNDDVLFIACFCGALRDNGIDSFEMCVILKMV